MIVIQDLNLSESQICHYLPDREWRFKYFFASELNGEELNVLLSRGWRKFGFYYFRPFCDGCDECVPIRVPVELYRPSGNQKNIIRKNKDVFVRFGELQFSEEIYSIYEAHSRVRFGTESSLDEFTMNFYTRSCPALQSEYYIDGKLAGVGFLDKTDEALSSVYYIFHPDYSSRSLGTFSAIREIAYARELGMKYYYLGYYIRGCGRMKYKNRFRPYELFDWNGEDWHLEDRDSNAETVAGIE
jgi:arginine-tRNA-protein transferase